MRQMPLDRLLRPRLPRTPLKTHKKHCTALANGETPISFGLHAKPFTAIQNDTFSHDMPEEKDFQVLVDVMRMRQEDEYALEGDIMEGSVYDPEPSSSAPAFGSCCASLLPKTASSLPGGRGRRRRSVCSMGLGGIRGLV